MCCGTQQGYPSGLVEWVANHYKEAKNDSDKQLIEEHIRDCITQMGSTVHDRNWSTEPMVLPAHLKQDKVDDEVVKPSTCTIF